MSTATTTPTADTEPTVVIGRNGQPVTLTPSEAKLRREAEANPTLLRFLYHRLEQGKTYTDALIAARAKATAK